MIKILKGNVCEIDETSDLKSFLLNKWGDDCEMFDGICTFYGMERGELCNSDLVFNWDKNNNEFYYSVAINESDSWGVELDELRLCINKKHLTTEELEYIFSC